MARKMGPQYTFNVNKMLELRVLGWSYSALGRHFHKNHTTIMYHCIKWQIVPLKQPPPVPKMQYTEEEVELLKEAAAPPKVYKYPDPFAKDGPINPGKTYKQYIAESLKRETERNYHKTYYEHYPDIHTSGVAPYQEEA